jgi:hypothetical protein
MSVRLVSVEGVEVDDGQTAYKKVLLVGNKIVNPQDMFDHIGVKRTFFIFVSGFMYTD